jgi:uncharacterized protein YbaR (Trm112 family)
MSTIESLHAQKLQKFRGMRSELEAKKASGLDVTMDMLALNQEETEYLLNVVPILKDYYTHETSEKTLLNGCVTVGTTSQKGFLFKKYMAEVENNDEYKARLAAEIAQRYASLDDRSICQDCEGNIELISTQEELVCPNCARCYAIMEWNANNLTFEQRINDVTPMYSYKRSNHFGEWLNKLQALEVTVIPQDVIDALKLELKKARILSAGDINQKTVKQYLKKLKLSKYYDHVAHITNLLTGKLAPRFSADLETKLKNMFEEIQRPFEMFCPKTRKNFLSYSYVLFKFCELLEQDEYLQYLPLLKSGQKLHQQDLIWKKICEHLRWQFIPSI